MPTVVYDANVLYPSTLRDVLLRVGIARLVTPRWTDQILDEVFSNLRKNRPDLDLDRLDRTRSLMNRAIPDVLVTGYQHHIAELTLPDPHDRHVLAAAIEAGASIVVTTNLKDFPPDKLQPHEITARHPDRFLHELHHEHPKVFAHIIHRIATSWTPTATPADVLKHLATEAPATAAAIANAVPAE